MPVVRNPQFYFKEGFCWSDINTTFLKCRAKQKSINDVKSMSLYGLAVQIPEYYIICLINSKFMSRYVDDFVNNTQTFQINDARQLPIIVPTFEELAEIKMLFDKLISLKKRSFASDFDDNINQELSSVEGKLEIIISHLYNLV